MNEPEFTVIIPSYQRAGMLEETLDSVLAQTVDDWECIVIDDASPDPVVVPDDDRFRIIRHDENLGPAACRNTGMQATRGRNVVFCDDDDLLTSERLAIAAEGLARAPVALCMSTEYGDRSRSSGRVLEGDVHDVILDATTPSMGVAAVRREALIPLDERYPACEDLDWWLRISKVAHVTTVNRVGFVWRRHAGPRHRVGLEARKAGRILLLNDHADYFRMHRRARAFQYRRLGMQAHELGETDLARRAFLTSLGSRPSARVLRDLARTYQRTHTTNGGIAPGILTGMMRQRRQEPSTATDSSPDMGFPKGGSAALAAATHARYTGPTSGAMPLDGALHVAPYQWCAEKFMQPGYEVLDCGCGEGFGARILALAGGVVTAVDLLERSPFSADVPDLGIQFISADIGASKLRQELAGPFELIVSHEVIEHLVDYFEFLRNVVALASETATIVIGTPNRHLTYEYYPDRSHMDTSHVQEFTVSSLHEIMRLFFGEVSLYAESVPRFPIDAVFGRPEPATGAQAVKSKIRDWVPPIVITLLRERRSRRTSMGQNSWTVGDVEIRSLKETDLMTAFRIIAVGRRPLRERCWERP